MLQSILTHNWLAVERLSLLVRLLILWLCFLLRGIRGMPNVDFVADGSKGYSSELVSLVVRSHNGRGIAKASGAHSKLWCLVWLRSCGCLCWWEWRTKQEVQGCAGRSFCGRSCGKGRQSAETSDSKAGCQIVWEARDAGKATEAREAHREAHREARGEARHCVYWVLLKLWWSEQLFVRLENSTDCELWYFQHISRL